MDKTTRRIVVFTLLGILALNVGVGLIRNSSDPTQNTNLNALNLAIIGTLGLYAGLAGKDNDDESRKK